MITRRRLGPSLPKALPLSILMVLVLPLLLLLLSPDEALGQSSPSSSSLFNLTVLSTGSLRGYLWPADISNAECAPNNHNSNLVSVVGRRRL